MALRVAIKLTGVEAYRRALAKLRKPELDKPVGRFLVRGILAVLKNASEQQIIRGGRFRGAGGSLRDSPPDPHRLTSRSGELRRSLGPSLGVDRSGLPSFIEGGTDLAYGPMHEDGLGRFPRRPFLEPALDAVEPELEGMLAAELEKELPA